MDLKELDRLKESEKFKKTPGERLILKKAKKDYNEARRVFDPTYTKKSRMGMGTNQLSELGKLVHMVSVIQVHAIR